MSCSRRSDIIYSHSGGDAIAWFTSNRSGKREVWGMTQAGVAQWTHKPGAGESWGLAPAANGDIVFTSDRDGKPEIYRASPNGIVAVTHTDGEGWSFTESKVGAYGNE